MSTLFEKMLPYMDGLSDHHQRILRHLYDQRYTRPYLGAMMGISDYQVMVNELAALRTILEAALPEPNNKPKQTRKRKNGSAHPAVGTKNERAAGPSGADA